MRPAIWRTTARECFGNVSWVGWVDVVSPEAVRWAAEQVVRMHSEPPSVDRATGTCRQCRPGEGCPALAWALKTLDFHQCSDR
jgi:hypothetical protein